MRHARLISEVYDFMGPCRTASTPLAGTRAARVVPLEVPDPAIAKI